VFVFSLGGRSVPTASGLKKWTRKLRDRDCRPGGQAADGAVAVGVGDSHEGRGRRGSALRLAKIIKSERRAPAIIFNEPSTAASPGNRRRRSFGGLNSRVILACMRSDNFTRAMLAVIALALVALVGQGTFSHLTPVDAALSVPTQWEYATVRMKFHWEGGAVTRTESTTLNGDPVTFASNRTELMSKMGQAEWELVTDTPYSLWSSQGSTTDEMLVFKRPHRQTSP
jgi:hypothetical protein